MISFSLSLLRFSFAIPDLIIKKVGAYEYMTFSMDNYRLIDNSTNQINLIEHDENHPIRKAISISPLNYTLIHTDEGTLNLIKWNADNPSELFPNIEFNQEEFYYSVTCLKTTFLCFISTNEGLIHRFDVRTIETGVVSQFKNMQPMDDLKITDTNLKYMFSMKGNFIYSLDPLTLQIKDSLNFLNEKSSLPKFLSTILSNPLVVVAD